MVTDKSEHKKIAIIGMGHMGNAIQNGLVRGGFKNKNIFCSNQSENNRNVVIQSDWILIAVKPKNVKQVLMDINDLVKDKLILSIAGGVTIDAMQTYCSNSSQPLMRFMPNIPVSINKGVIGMYCNRDVSQSVENEVKKVFSSLGTIIEVANENDLDALTILSGCGPAIVANFMEMMSNQGSRLGLSKINSDKMVRETIQGTVLFLQEKNMSFTDLQNMVATKGGVTEEILKSMKAYRLKKLFAKSLENGYSKLRTLKMNLNKKVEEI